MHPHLATISGVEGQFKVICIKEDISGIRGLFMGINDPEIWQDFKDFKALYTITNQWSIEYWFHLNNLHDFAAIKNGIHRLVNTALRVIKERGGKYSIIDLRHFFSQREFIEIKVGLEKWVLTDFWKKWLALFFSCPVIALVTLVTNNLIKLREDVLKKYRYADVVTLLTYKGQ